MAKKEVQSIGNTNFSTQNNPIAFFVICYLNGDKFFAYRLLRFYSYDYCNRKGISEGIYIVFIEDDIDMPGVVEGKEVINEVEIKTYLIKYDEVKDFGEED